MAAIDSSSWACVIVRRSCTLLPVCSQCKRECKACLCWRCTVHGHTYKLCRECYENRVSAGRAMKGFWWRQDWEKLAASWCRLQRTTQAHDTQPQRP
jgi:hypothetical protein